MEYIFQAYCRKKNLTLEIVNAIKYTPEGITVTTTLVDENWDPVQE